MYLAFVPLRPDPTWGLLRCFFHGPQGSSSASSRDGQFFHPAVSRWAYNHTGANHDRRYFGSESSVAQVSGQVIVLFGLVNMGSFTSGFVWHSEFNQKDLDILGLEYYIGSRASFLDDLWVVVLSWEICCSLPITCFAYLNFSVRSAWDVCCLSIFFWPLSAWNHLGFCALFFILMVLNLTVSVSSFSTWLWLQVYLPWVTDAFQQLRTCLSFIAEISPILPGWRLTVGGHTLIWKWSWSWVEPYTTGPSS